MRGSLQTDAALDPGMMLKEKVTVHMRTRSQLKPQRVDMNYDPAHQTIELAHYAVDESHHGDEDSIALADIASVKVKDFTGAAGEEHYVWSLTRRSDELEQMSFEFQSREERDQWGYAMRTLVNESGVVSLSGAVADHQNQRRGRTIKHIDPDKPEYGTIVQLRVELADGSAHILQVRDDQAAPQDCKKAVNQFIQENTVLDAEQHSLYRYVRSMVERVRLERDTQKIVDEINALHLEEVAHKSGVNINNAINMNQIKENARKQLSELSDNLESRLGKRGPGAAIVTMILRRNIEKMKMINEVYQKAAQAGIAPGQGHGPEAHAQGS
mmetsp:Transcript_8001/g.17840  ORF Transcript_8001/g.17840 Transcript_8001/m.17840 type:complete len:327 (-) Transcript_8001:85-1065(-)